MKHYVKKLNIILKLAQQKGEAHKDNSITANTQKLCQVQWHQTAKRSAFHSHFIKRTHRMPEVHRGDR